MLSFKGAIFDMDGTLLDSMPMWRRGPTEILLRSGGKMTEEIKEHVQHLNFIDASAYLASLAEPPMRAEDFGRAWHAYVTDFYQNEALPKPGVPEYLRALAEKGIPMTLATLTDRFHAEPVMERLELMPLFMRMLTVNEVGKRKSEPDIYLECARLMGTPVAETMVFEDAFYAAKTAKQAGFLVAGVYDSTQPFQEELKALSDLYITDYRTLLPAR